MKHNFSPPASRRSLVLVLVLVLLLMLVIEGGSSSPLLDVIISIARRSGRSTPLRVVAAFAAANASYYFPLVATVSAACYLPHARRVPPQ